MINNTGFSIAHNPTLRVSMWSQYYRPVTSFKLSGGQVYEYMYNHMEQNLPVTPSQTRYTNTISNILLPGPLVPQLTRLTTRPPVHGT